MRVYDTQLASWRGKRKQARQGSELPAGMETGVDSDIQWVGLESNRCVGRRLASRVLLLLCLGGGRKQDTGGRRSGNARKPGMQTLCSVRLTQNAS